MIMATVLSVAGSGALAIFTDAEASTGNTFTAGVWEDPVIQVDIDIVPGIYPNVIYLDWWGWRIVEVAIMSTSAFDARHVRPWSVRFGPGGASSWWVEERDVDGDTNIDVVFHFFVWATGLGLPHTTATLIGQTYPLYGGRDIRGSDSVVVRP